MIFQKYPPKLRTSVRSEFRMGVLKTSFEDIQIFKNTSLDVLLKSLFENYLSSILYKFTDAYTVALY